MSAPQLSIFERPAMLRDAAPVLASVPRSGMTLRPYQVEACAAIETALATRRSTLLTLCTGGGKTVIFADLARKRGGALVIAHEQSLIDQAAQKLRHVTGEYVAVEKAERRAPAGSRFVVASMQTLRGDRLRFFADTNQHHEFIVIDEAHRALAKSYRDIIAAFPRAKVLGVTATADRGDKKALGLVFEKADTDHGAAFKYDIADACADGWLAMGDWFPMDITGVSLDDVRVKGGELDQDELDEQVAQQAGQIAQAIIQHCGTRRMLAFCPGVQSAVVTAEAINRIEPGTARSIHGAMDPEEKRAIKAAHARGDFPRLLNCQILIEGYDDPRLSDIVMISKTKSRARFAQIYGRGGRPWPLTVDGLETPAERLAAIAASPKPRFRFFDANYGQHGHTLAGPVDLLGGKYDDAVKERAKKNLEAKGGGDVGEALELAAAELEAEKARKLAKIAAAAAKAKGKVLVGAARSASELFGVSVDMGSDEDERGGGEPMESVVSWLVERGVRNAADMPDSAARGLKRKLAERKRLGLGSFKQVRALKKAGVAEAATLTAGECGRLMDVLIPRYNRGDWNFQFRPDQIATFLGRREPGGEG